MQEPKNQTNTTKPKYRDWETGVGYGIQEKALGLQLASTASQIALNESQANKNNDRRN